ncbi:hypothetical protein EK21DRAFT_48216, partial [Setomelanomma holmii]
TVDQSVVQVEDSQARDVQYQQNGEDFDEGEESDQEEDEYDEDDVDGADDVDKYPITQEESEILQAAGQSNLTRPEAFHWLRKHSVGGLPVVEGDSYPPTSDGQITEWDGVLGGRPEDFDHHVGSMSPSPRHPISNDQRPLAPPPMDRGYRGGVGPVASHPIDNMFSKSANIREQQRKNSSHSQQLGQAHHGNAAPVHSNYDLETLHKMSYDDLKTESFDTNPQAPEQPLSTEMFQKPLIERLEHVQKNFGHDKQAEFFQSLSTTEWEDAGDWFLEQFSAIIRRSRDARKKKRKLAQDFEDEVEKRHKHVSKKQHQVEDAMSKMKAQGEGLVPKSPR